MAVGEDEPPLPNTKVCKLSITDELTSSTSEAAGTRPSDVDSGHERLLKHTASAERTAISHSRPSRPPHYLMLGLIMTVVCFPFGIIAVVFSLMSRHSYKKGHQTKASDWGNVSKWLSIIGLAVTAVLAGFMVVYFVHIDKNIVDTPEELKDIPILWTTQEMNGTPETIDLKPPVSQSLKDPIKTAEQAGPVKQVHVAMVTGRPYLNWCKMSGKGGDISVFDKY